MALSQTKIRFAQLQLEFTRAYKARDRHAVNQYADQIHALLIALACGGVAL